MALVSVKLDAIGFRKYRCDRPMPLGVNLGSLTKVLKCAKDDDIVTIKAGDDADVLNLTYEAKSKSSINIIPSEIWLRLCFVHVWSCALENLSFSHWSVADHLSSLQIRIVSQNTI